MRDFVTEGTNEARTNKRCGPKSMNRMHRIADFEDFEQSERANARSLVHPRSLQVLYIVHRNGRKEHKRGPTSDASHIPLPLCRGTRRWAGRV